MRDNSKDSALERNLIRDWHHKCQEYEQVKAGKHPKFRFMADFHLPRRRDPNRQANGEKMAKKCLPFASPFATIGALNFLTKQVRG